LARRYHGYHWRLSRPWQAQRGGTSQLSAHLAAGTISSREVSRAVQAKLSELDEHASERDRFALRSYLDRLRWRDSARQKFWLRPELAEGTGIREFDEVHRLRELSQLEATAYERWQEGTTGYPLLDASMRQLSRDGWIPFRMRAMAATFLCINCQVPWQYGALHFMNCLADGEACIDHWQWQSQAGLTDVLAATFRIYNPQKNLREKDPKLRYVRHWLPELAQHTDEEILRGTARYAEPVVEWESSRRLGGDALSEMRGRAQRRLTSQGGPLYEEAQRLRQAVSKYKRNKQRKYREMSEGRQLGLFDGE
jgi:deoxyribodipyrimidine photo-lyase